MSKNLGPLLAIAEFIQGRRLSVWNFLISPVVENPPRLAGKREGGGFGTICEPVAGFCAAVVSCARIASGNISAKIIASNVTRFVIVLRK